MAGIDGENLIVAWPRIIGTSWGNYDGYYFWVIFQLSEPSKPYSSTLFKIHTQGATSALFKTIFLQPELRHSQWVTDVLPASSHSILVKILRKKDYQHFQFTNEETETQGQTDRWIHFSLCSCPHYWWGYVPSGCHPVDAWNRASYQILYIPCFFLYTRTYDKFFKLSTVRD